MDVGPARHAAGTMLLGVIGGRDGATLRTDGLRHPRHDSYQPPTTTMITKHDDWTPGEARLWARRLRRIGFSPVSLHHDTDGSVTGSLGGWYLRCNWPYDFYHAWIYDDYNDIEYTLKERSGIWLVGDRHAAGHLLATFRAVRLGMGSRPFPAVDRTLRGPQFTAAGRIVADADDWPPDGQRHPCYMP